MPVGGVKPGKYVKDKTSLSCWDGLKSGDHVNVGHRVERRVEEELIRTFSANKRIDVHDEGWRDDRRDARRALWAQ